MRSLVRPIRSLLRPTRVLGPTNQVIAPTNEVLGPSNQVIAPTNQVLGRTNEVLGPTNEVLGPTNHVLDPTNHVLGPTNHVLGPTSQSGSLRNPQRLEPRALQPALELPLQSAVFPSLRAVNVRTTTVPSLTATVRYRVRKPRSSESSCRTLAQAWPPTVITFASIRCDVTCPPLSSRHVFRALQVREERWESLVLLRRLAREGEHRVLLEAGA